MAVTLETGPSGSIVMVEPELRKGLLAACSATRRLAIWSGRLTTTGNPLTSAPASSGSPPANYPNP
jgi:hypothetical protein